MLSRGRTLDLNYPKIFPPASLSGQHVLMPKPNRLIVPKQQVPVARQTNWTLSTLCTRGIYCETRW